MSSTFRVRTLPTTLQSHRTDHFPLHVLHTPTGPYSGAGMDTRGSEPNCLWRGRGPSSIPGQHLLREGTRAIPSVWTKVGEKGGKVGLKTFLRPLQRPRAYSPVFFFQECPEHSIISVCKTFLKITTSETWPLTLLTEDSLMWSHPSKITGSLWG